MKALEEEVRRKCKHCGKYNVYVLRTYFVNNEMVLNILTDCKTAIEGIIKTIKEKYI